jgi:hypothetical protein
MARHTDRSDRPIRRSRRAVLAGTATALAAGAGHTGRARGQQITFPAVIPTPDRWADENLAGFMIHVGPTTDPAELAAAESCDLADWPPETTFVYDATLINRKQGDTPEEDTLLYASDNAPIPAGALFLINTFTTCESDHVGINLKQIGRYDVGGGDASDYGPAADVEEDERPNAPTNTSGSSGAVASGFGVLAALTGTLAGVWLRLRDGE